MNLACANLVPQRHEASFTDAAKNAAKRSHHCYSQLKLDLILDAIKYGRKHFATRDGQVPAMMSRAPLAEPEQITLSARERQRE